MKRDAQPGVPRTFERRIVRIPTKETQRSPNHTQIGTPCHHSAHGRAALGQPCNRYRGIAPRTAREIVSYTKASDVPEQAHRYAEISVQMIRALLWLYFENERSDREALVAELKSALVDNLSPRLR